MKRIDIISEAVYKGQQKLVNQGAFINLSDIMTDVFGCFGMPCCTGVSDYYLRKAYLMKSRKKPQGGWLSLNKIIVDVFNCDYPDDLCVGFLSEQWWISTEVIRPRKTIETINFTCLLQKVITCCAFPAKTYNFDVSATSWSGEGVTDQATFEAWLLANSTYTTLTLQFFEYTDTNIKCDIVATGGTTLDFSSSGITVVNRLQGFAGLVEIDLSANAIVTFNPLSALSATLTDLILSNNAIVTFNPTIALPATLEKLYLDDNSIVTFNPTLALPVALTHLYLQNNDIVTFDTTLALPASLLELVLTSNQIVSFSPAQAIPLALTGLYLNSNLMTTAGYTASEAWATGLAANLGTTTIVFTGNVNSVAATNLETILTGSGYIVTA